MLEDLLQLLVHSLFTSAVLAFMTLYNLWLLSAYMTENLPLYLILSEHANWSQIAFHASGSIFMLAFR